MNAQLNCKVQAHVLQIMTAQISKQIPLHMYTQDNYAEKEETLSWSDIYSKKRSDQMITHSLRQCKHRLYYTRKALRLALRLALEWALRWASLFPTLPCCPGSVWRTDQGLTMWRTDQRITVWRTDQGLTVWRTDQGLTVWRTDQGLTVRQTDQGLIVWQTD